MSHDVLIERFFETLINGDRPAARQIVAYAVTLSKITWAAILMVGSFLSLGVGFLLSLRVKATRTTAVR